MLSLSLGLHGLRRLLSVAAIPAAVMPTGALGVWYADEYVATPRPAIPNSLSAVPISPTLLGPQRRLYSNVVFWTKASATITDSYADSHDSKTGGASRFNGTGDSSVSKQRTVPAGTYTLAVWVKSNTGSNQDFRMRFFLDSLSATKTATTSWQRFTFTAASAGGARTFMPIASADGVTALDVVFSDAELFAGSEDLGQLAAGHIMLGLSGLGEPAYASGAVDLNSSYGTVQLADPSSVSQFTTIAIVQKTNTGSTYQSWFSHIPGFASFSAFMERSTSANPPAGSQYLSPYGAGLWKMLTLGWQAIGHRYDGTKHETFLNDVNLYRRTAAFTTVALQDAWVGLVTSTSFLSGYKLAAMAIWPRALTDEEYIAAYDILKARAALSANDVAPPRILISEGDSITYGTLAEPYPALFGPNSSPRVIGNNLAASGSYLSTVIARNALADDVIPATKGGRMFVYSLLIGRNDSAAWGTAADYAAAVATHLAGRKTAGFDKVVLCTMLPTGPSHAGGPTFNPWRNDFNSIVTAPGWAAANGVDAICDFAADATMGPDAAGDNATYYPDKVHPSAAGYAILEPIYRAAINAL